MINFLYYIARNGALLVSAFLFVAASEMLSAQVAHFTFDDSLVDSINGYDPDFNVDDSLGDSADIFYVDGVSDGAIHLEKRHGLYLPIEVTDTLLASNVWVFKMRFKVTDFGDGDGGRMLINLKRSGTNSAPFFRLYMNKLSDTDCRLVFRINNRGTDLRKNGSEFKLNEWIEFTFSIDFDEQFYSIASGDFFLTAGFDNFDYDQLKTYGGDNSLQSKRFYIGYYEELDERHNNENYADDESAEVVIDELTIYDAHTPTNVATLENALQLLTNHLNGTTSLSTSEISAYALEALSNYRGNYLTSKSVVDGYFAAYEVVYEPMFMHENNVDFYATYDEFGWVLLNLQLDVFDNYVSLDHIDQIEGVVFETHVAFPGPVADTASRLDDQSVFINGTYVADLGYNIKTKQVDYGTFARRGTGLYAAPGERITVEVPAEMVGVGAEIVIGSHTHDVGGKLDGIKRMPRVVSTFSIDSSSVDVASPLGGIIYITIPEGTALGLQQLTISGAVKFAYFPKNSANQNGDIIDFNARVQSGEVLWAEVETDNFMFTGPLAFFKRDDIVEAVDTWDDMWEAYQMVFGRPFPRHNAEHLVIDKMTKWNTLAGGYPMVLTWSSVPYVTDFWVVSKSNMMNILDFQYAIQDDKATYWHEMSHHNGLPTMGNERECIVELAYVAAFHLGYGMDLDDAFRYSERGYMNRNDAIIDWVITDNFANNAEMEGVQRQYQHRGYSKYVDIAVLFGWEELGAINKVFYDYWTSIGGQTNDPEEYIITDSEWILASCETLNANVAPLYHFWGEQPETDILDEVNSYPRSVEVYQRLREIRNLIPKSAKDFQPYFDEHAPTNTQNNDYLNYQDALADWQTTRAKILAQIDYILEFYYGSDFDEDGMPFLIDADDTDAAVGLSVADSDGDGESDLTEYALGGDVWSAAHRSEMPRVYKSTSQWQFEHLLRSGDTLLNYKIMSTDDLTADDWTEATLEVLDMSDHDDTFEKVIYSLPDADQLFLRLELSYP